MKNGKNPTLRQKKAIDAAGFDPAEWLVCKAMSGQLQIIKRSTGETTIIQF